MKLRRSGQVSVSLLTVIFTVALAGTAGMTSLGQGMRDALVGRGGAGVDPGRSSFEDPRAPSPSAPVTTALAGVARVLAHADDFINPEALLPEVRAVRRPKEWRRPRHAFGDPNNEIQFALELEGDGDGIVEAYRHKGVSEEDWADFELEDYDDFLERTFASGGSWGQFVRREDGHVGLSPKLKSDLGRWEITTDMFVRTVDELFDQASWLRETVENGESFMENGFHWHASFRYSPAHRKEILALYEHLNDYQMLNTLRHQNRNMRNSFVGVRTVEEIENLRRILESGKLSEITDMNDKFHFAGFRWSTYDEADRVGIELRALNFDIGAAAKVMDATVRSLEDPKTPIALNKGRPKYRVADLVDIDRTKFVDYRSAKPALDFAGAGDSATNQARWAIPYQRWEDRPFFDDAARAAIVRERKAYTEKVRAAYHGTTDRTELATILDDLVEEWAAKTRLWEQF
ncbi:MAG: hypothetical protein KC416_02670 [Myxococcales bacterium]|nr:hypothetical protein [Myxococcales bacterium]